MLDEPVPVVDAAEAARIAHAHWGLTDQAVALRSERDRNFRIGEHVLKVSNSAEPDEVVDFEIQAMRHVAAGAPDLTIPQLVPALDGRIVIEHTAADGRRHLARVVTVLPGEPADAVELAPDFAVALGSRTARLAQALQGFSHPAALRTLEWDPRLVGERRADALGLTDRRDRIVALIDDLADLPSRTAALPSWPQHGDVTLSNVLTTDGATISGVIDFGDMHHTARVSDAAIALAAMLRVAPDPWRAIDDFLRGYQRVQPLTLEEAQVLGDLVLARLVLVVVISTTRPAADAHQAATTADLEARGGAVLDVLLDAGREVVRDRVLRACGLSRARRWAADQTLATRRSEATGGSLGPLFYDTPIQITHGEGAWVFDADGRRYLDGYNNVPVVGHAHPAVANAVGSQLRELAVHSRYLHPHLVELAERLKATMPTELDTVVLVNSGSEANDLAWRLATHWTGRSGAIVSDWCYHGVSAATAPLSSSTWVEQTRPAHVATFGVPRSVEGIAPTDGADRIAHAREWLRDRGLDVALTAADLSFTSPGMLTPTDAFVRGLVSATHEAGGLFVADEVQSGYGRTGSGLWAFAQHGVVPDFVTLGKPMGNGHPVAALVTRREIVDRFTEVDEFFSTFGGNPVSCVAALTVLDVIEDQDLVANSARQGEALRSGLVSIGAALGIPVLVRGQGLLAGVELPTIPGGVPLLVQALLERGVLTSTTGPGAAVLKVRPPLIWQAEHVAYFLDAFEDALGSMAGGDDAPQRASVARTCAASSATTSSMGRSRPDSTHSSSHTCNDETTSPAAIRGRMSRNSPEACAATSARSIIAMPPVHTDCCTPDATSLLCAQPDLVRRLRSRNASCVPRYRAVASRPATTRSTAVPPASATSTSPTSEASRAACNSSQISALPAKVL